MAQVYHMVSIISFSLAGICLIAAVFCWFRFGIPKIIGDLSGYTARKSIGRIRAENERTGKKSYRREAMVYQKNSPLSPEQLQFGKSPPDQNEGAIAAFSAEDKTDKKRNQVRRQTTDVLKYNEENGTECLDYDEENATALLDYDEDNGTALLEYDEKNAAYLSGNEREGVGLTGFGTEELGQSPTKADFRKRPEAFEPLQDILLIHTDETI